MNFEDQGQLLVCGHQSSVISYQFSVFSKEHEPHYKFDFKENIAHGIL